MLLLFTEGEETPGKRPCGGCSKTLFFTFSTWIGNYVLIKIAYIFWLFIFSELNLPFSYCMQYIQCGCYYWRNKVVKPMSILPTTRRHVDQYHPIRHFTSIKRHHCCHKCKVEFQGDAFIIKNVFNCSFRNAICFTVGIFVALCDR